MIRSISMLAAVSLAALAAPAFAQPHQRHAMTEEAQVKTYTAQQFFESTSYRVGSPSGFNFSPDGEFVLVTSDATGVFNAYKMPVAGGEPVPLTQSSTNATFGASFFPDDPRVLFTADEGGNELNHLFVMDMAGTVTDLTPGEELKAAFAGWNADGKTFYVTTNERDSAAFDLYAYDAATYERSRVFTNEGGFSISDVSPDGRWVALSKALSSANSDLYVADLSAAGAEPKLITPHEGNVSYGAYTFTRDNAALIYATNEHGEFSQAWRYDLASGKKSPVVEADWDVAFLQYSPTGR